MGVYAAGNSYGIPEDLIYSFPIEIKVSPSGADVTPSLRGSDDKSGRPLTSLSPPPQNKTWKMVDGLSINQFSRAKMDATAAELVEERDTALDFLSQ